MFWSVYFCKNMYLSTSWALFLRPLRPSSSHKKAMINVHKYIFEIFLSVTFSDNDFASWATGKRFRLQIFHRPVAGQGLLLGQENPCQRWAMYVLIRGAPSTRGAQ